MDSKTLIKALKSAVREVIKEELTEILREGLQSTINEMTSTTHIGKQRSVSNPIPEPPVKNKVQFKSTGFADILNETPSLRESGTGISSFAELVNEDVDTLSFTSADAQGFGMLRANQQPKTQVML